MKAILSAVAAATTILRPFARADLNQTHARGALVRLDQGRTGLHELPGAQWTATPRRLGDRGRAVHLHRLQLQQDVAGLDALARDDGDLDHGAGHRRGKAACRRPPARHATSPAASRRGTRSCRVYPRPRVEAATAAPRVPALCLTPDRRLTRWAAR